MRRLVWLSLCSLVLFSGCQRPVAEFKVTDNLTLVVKKMEVGDDFYRSVIAFKERTHFQTVVQEVMATNYYGYSYQLVESFDTIPLDDRVSPTKRHTAFEISAWDRHSGKNVEGWEHREYHFYAADVRGEDKTRNGFALLPKNYDGSMVTNVHGRINRRYLNRHEIRGQIVRRHRETGTYEIHWRPGELYLTTPVGGVTLVKGEGITVYEGHRVQDFGRAVGRPLSDTPDWNPDDNIYIEGEK